jgi:hypothetical protein
MLPTDSAGALVYAGLGCLSTDGGNELWLPLAEKAYAQWNETGKAGRNGTNTYPSLDNGWTDRVDDQVLGPASRIYWDFSDADRQALIDGIVNNKAVAFGTLSSDSDGLIGQHAYVVVGYRKAPISADDQFILYNPHGKDHPSPLTWAQLRTNGAWFVIADASKTVPANSTSAAKQTQARPTVRTRRSLWFAPLAAPRRVGPGDGGAKATPFSTGVATDDRPAIAALVESGDWSGGVRSDGRPVEQVCPRR